MKGFKSLSVTLGVILAVSLIILGTRAIKKGIDETTAIATALPKYSFGQVVEIELKGFFKTCNNRGVVTDYSHGIYTIDHVICDTQGLYEMTKTFKLLESSIIKVIKEKD